jgi:hypothetical protein
VITLRQLTDGEVRLAVRLATAQLDRAWTDWLNSHPEFWARQANRELRLHYLSWVVQARQVRAEFRRRRLHQQGRNR